MTRRKRFLAVFLCGVALLIVGCDRGGGGNGAANAGNASSNKPPLRHRVRTDADDPSPSPELELPPGVMRAEASPAPGANRTGKPEPPRGAPPAAGPSVAPFAQPGIPQPPPGTAYVPSVVPTPYPIQYVPDDAVLAVGFRPGPLMADPIVREIWDEYAQAKADNPLVAIQEKFGLRPDDVEAVLLVYPEEAFNQQAADVDDEKSASAVYLIVQMNVLATQAVQEPFLALFRERNGGLHPDVIEGVPVHVTEDGTAVAFTPDRCVVIAPQAAIGDIVRPRPAPSSLGAAIAEAGEEEVAYAFRFASEDEKGKAASSLPLPLPLAPIVHQCNSLLFTASLSGPMMTMRAEMESDADAQRVNTILEALREKMREELATEADTAMVPGVPDAAVPKLKSVLDQTINGTTITVDGPIVRVELPDDERYRQEWISIARLQLEQAAMAGPDSGGMHPVGDTPKPPTGKTSPPATPGRGEKQIVTTFDEGDVAMLIDVSPWNGYSLAFSPDGNWLVVGKLDRALMLIDLEAGELLGPFEGHHNALDAVLFSKDGSQVVSAGRDELFLWDFDPELKTLTEKQRLTGHSGLDTRLVHDADDEHVLSLARDKSVRYWSITDASQEQLFDGFERDPIAVAPGRERRTAYATDGQSLYTLDLSRGRISRTQDLSGRGYARLRQATFSPNGRFLAGATGSDLQIWGLARLGASPKFGERGGVTWCLGYTPDGERLITGTGKSVSIWDASSRRLVATLAEQPSYPKALTVSPDGKLAATTGDSFVRVWRLDGR